MRQSLGERIYEKEYWNRSEADGTRDPPHVGAFFINLFPTHVVS